MSALRSVVQILSLTRLYDCRVTEALGAARVVEEEQEDTSATTCIKLCATATCATKATNSAIPD